MSRQDIVRHTVQWLLMVLSPFATRYAFNQFLDSEKFADYFGWLLLSLFWFVELIMLVVFVFHHVFNPS